MRINSILATGAALALLMAPGALARGPKADDHPGNGQAKAHGRLCQDQSKKHVEGQTGTPFSQCVVAMAHLQSGKAETPKAACKKLSKKHRKGKKGTPFSRCVKAGHKLEDERLSSSDYGDDRYADPFGDD
jgi:hypothetical protein